MKSSMFCHGQNCCLSFHRVLEYQDPYNLLTTGKTHFPFNSRIDKFSSQLLLRTCLHGGGEPQIGEVTYGGSPHLSCKRAQHKRLYEQAGYPPKQVTSPTWGPLPPCKRALNYPFWSYAIICSLPCQKKCFSAQSINMLSYY